MQFGVAGFADFPQGDYGGPDDVEYRLYQAITDESDALIAAIDRLKKPLMNGDDAPDVLAGRSWVSGVFPNVHEGVSGGQTVCFTVELEGQRDASIEDLPYNVYLWARGDGAALLSCIKIPIVVAKE